MQITACETDFFNNKIILESQQKIKKKEYFQFLFTGRQNLRESLNLRMLYLMEDNISIDLCKDISHE